MGKSKKSKKFSSSDSEEWAEKESIAEKKISKKSKNYSSSDSEERHNRRKKKASKSKMKKRNYSTSSDDSSSDEKYKKKKSKKKKTKHEYSSSSDITSSTDDDQKHSKAIIDVNKQNPNIERDEWMNLQSKFLTTSNSDRKKEREEQKRLEREKQQYDPRSCDRELNPYWKHGGDGLPKFKKPDDSDDEQSYRSYKSTNYKSKLPNAGSSSWRKTNKEDIKEKSSTSATSSNWRKTQLEDNNTSNTTDLPHPKQTSSNTEEIEYTEKDLNVLAAKLVKAEIMGNTKQITELKEKLEKARNSIKHKKHEEEVILTQTDAKGQSKPLRLQSEYEESSKSKKKKKLNTHQGNERVRYFADDDKYSLKEMFENEKYQAGTDQDKEFLKAYSKIKKNDDLDDIFSDNIRDKESDKKIDEKNRSRAIKDHQKTSKSLDNCDRCLQSEFMLKHLMVSMGDTVYLALPPHEPLTEGHCLILPIRHTPCATQLDENEWSDILDVRKSLVRLFKEQTEDVIFFECAMGLHRFPHMVIECIPVPKEEGDMAPIYFKKAIDESEIEWAQNKKLVSLKGRDVRKAIPKGLPYFSVSFGMEEGFAHVIEDEQLFPNNFAQEIIGGMLDLDHSKWRKPKRQSFEDQSKRVMEFSKKWKEFDCLGNY